MARKSRPNSTAEPKQTAAQTAALDKIRRWWDDDKAAKDFYVREMDENDKLYRGDHWDLIGPNGKPLRTRSQQSVRPNAVENIVFQLIDGEVSEFSKPVDLVDFPKDETDEEVAVVMTDLKKFIADKNHMPEERIKWLWNFFLHGTGIWETVWDPTWQGGRGPNRWVGEVRWRSVHPRAIFPDARCGESIHDGRRIHKAKYVTLEHIREKYPEYGHLAGSEVMDLSLVSSDERVVPPATEGDDRILLVETWYIGRPLILNEGEVDQGKGLHVIWWCGETSPVYLRHANYVYYAPGEDCRFPFVFRQRHHRDGSVWGYGDAHFIRQVQIIHNKTIETIIEGHLYAAVGRVFYNAGAVDEKQQRSIEAKGSLPGTWHAVNDINGLRPDRGLSMPASLIEEAGRGPRVMENILGRPDVSQGKNPGSVTAAAALEILQRRAASRFIAADVAITSGIEEAGDYINRLIFQNYTERRAYRIIGLNEAEDRLVLQKRGVFDLDSVKRVYDFNNGTVLPLKEFEALRATEPYNAYVEGEDYEVYVPELDVKCKTSQQMPSDRFFFLEMAKELLAVQAIDLEEFYYVVENGRFRSWHEIKKRM